MKAPLNFSGAFIRIGRSSNYLQQALAVPLT